MINYSSDEGRSMPEVRKYFLNGKDITRLHVAGFHRLADSISISPV